MPASGDSGGRPGGVFFLFRVQKGPRLALGPTFLGGRSVGLRVRRAVVCALGRVCASLGPPEKCAGHSAVGRREVSSKKYVWKPVVAVDWVSNK